MHPSLHLPRKRFFTITFTAAAICILGLAIAVSARRAPFQFQYQLTLVDHEGHRTRVGAIPGTTFAPRVSPDGREVIYDTQDDGQLWIAKLSDVTSQRRLTTSGSNRGEIWTPDGKRVFYITDDGPDEALFSRASDGSGPPELISKPTRAIESFSPRGDILSFITMAARGDYDVWTYSLSTKQRTPFAVVGGTPQHSSHFSPDGKWIAYVSAETGRLEVYVRPFPAGTPAVQVSHNGGEHPLWSPDQKELYFDVNHRMFAASISTNGVFTAGAVKELPIQGFIQGPLRRQYDLMPDGKQFLMMFQ